MDFPIDMDMTYPEAIEYFRSWLQGDKNMDKQKECYWAQIRSSRVINDLRNCIGDEAIKSVESELDGPTLIFIDGPGCNGKSVLASALQKNFKAVLFDLKGVSEDGISMNDFSYGVTSPRDMELEEKVMEALRKGAKVVIVAGRFMKPMYRAIALYTLGRHFNKVISMFCVQKNVKEVIDLMEKMKSEREARGHKVSEEEINSIVMDWTESCRLMTFEGSNDLLIGSDVFYLVDSHCIKNPEVVDPKK